MPSCWTKGVKRGPAIIGQKCIAVSPPPKDTLWALFEKLLRSDKIVILCTKPKEEKAGPGKTEETGARLGCQSKADKEATDIAQDLLKGTHGPRFLPGSVCSLLHQPANQVRVPGGVVQGQARNQQSLVVEQFGVGLRLLAIRFHGGLQSLEGRVLHVQLQDPVRF